MKKLKLLLELFIHIFVWYLLFAFVIGSFDLYGGFKSDDRFYILLLSSFSVGLSWLWEYLNTNF